MPDTAHLVLISRRYREVHGACSPRSFEHFLTGASDHGSTAALGYRVAGVEPLFLEIYLAEPVELAVSRALQRHVLRHEIVELGNLAAINGLAMIDLWGRAANDLSSVSRVAVATLTAPVRNMFARIGLQVIELAPARPAALGAAAEHWGRYFDMDPRVCVGLIADGQQALARHAARRAAAGKLEQAA